MENIQLRYIFDRQNRANNDTVKGLIQIEVRITGTNRRKLISTGVHLYKNQFSIKNSFTCKNQDNSPAITGAVKRMFTRIEAFVLSEKCKTLEDVRNWDKDESSTHSVVEFMRDSLRKRTRQTLYSRTTTHLLRKYQSSASLKYSPT